MHLKKAPKMWTPSNTAADDEDEEEGEEGTNKTSGREQNREQKRGDIRRLVFCMLHSILTIEVLASKSREAVAKEHGAVPNPEAFASLIEKAGIAMDRAITRLLVEPLAALHCTPSPFQAKANRRSSNTLER